MRARDAAGNVSAASASVTATTQSTTPPGSLKVQYKNNGGSATDGEIRPGLQVVNTGSGALSLSTVKVRYYFTRDGSTSINVFCDYAQLGCGNLTTAVVALPTAVNGADAYLEIGFTGGSLAAGANTGEMQLRLNKADWSSFNENNDYSYGTGTAFTDATKVTAYVGGTLSWGVVPS
ncbi:cellulose binding domain-containing protein [Catellatospora sp. KI3]|uniref:cellulose binding domain-containing protein n=1 Tax=Catellatospora sp. KI3 TaxID=3041620 RepID=UPI00248316A4|nr:cellulose binding domain-containing protein [Catellatospora sp. KI3]MDI1464494.1 cellulose binding domain-containing protein [Catellatospora sp. KI3]